MIPCNIFSCVDTSHQSHGQVFVIKCHISSPDLDRDEKISMSYLQKIWQYDRKAVCLLKFWGEFLFCLLTCFVFAKGFFSSFFFLFFYIDVYIIYTENIAFLCWEKKEDLNLFLKSHCSKLKACILRHQNQGNVCKRSIYCWGVHAVFDWCFKYSYTL